MHLGKSGHFRKSGIPLTMGSVHADLEKLGGLIEQFDPQRMIFLGDLFHSEYNAEWEIMVQWVKKFPKVEFELIEGNHDLLSHEHYKLANMNVLEQVVFKDICFTHEPADLKDAYNVCGHIHPGVRLVGKARQSIRIPCFHLGKKRMVLPAFGSLTGLYMMEAKEDEIIYGIANGRLLKLS